MAKSEIRKIEEVIDGLLDSYRLVFWYDEGGGMQLLAASMQLQGAEVLVLQDNPFSIKHRILKGQQPERGFVVYSPNAQPTDDDNWLLDLQMSGALFSADRGALYAAECGIPLELKVKVVDAHIEFFKVSNNRQKLAKMLHIGMDSPVIERKMMEIVIKTEPVYDQITYILAKEAEDGKNNIALQLEKYKLDDIYWNDINKAFNYKGEYHIKDLLAVLFSDDLQQHITSSSLTNEAHIFMRDWRDSRQYGELYKEWASELEEELGVKQLVDDYPMEQLVRIETFPYIDKRIACMLQTEVMNGTMTAEQIADIVEEREHKIFFSVANHTLKALLEARRMMEDVDRRMSGLIINSAEECINLYYKELFVIDLDYRHYFREAKQAESTNLLGDVSELVQRTYTNSFLSVLAGKWQPFVDVMDKWKIDGFISQQSFYNYHVSNFVSKGHKLFVIISDGLRYESMVELKERIEAISRMETTMKQPMIATQPSYTQLGMAALLPHSQLSYEKQADEVFADGQSTKGTEARQKVLAKKTSMSLAIRAEEFLQITSPKTYFKDYDLIYVYSNVIDKMGDNKETEGNVFKATEDEFDHIIRIVELIRNGNGSNILITSDHGYLYQNEQLDESDFTDFKVMGDIITDTRRFVVGNNLQPGNAVKTWESQQVGLKEGRQIQITKSLNRLRKQGSGSRYVHGGSMPQEIVVPVLHVNIKKAKDISQVDVDILNKRARLTTNNQTINFYQTEVASEKVKGITLRMGFYDNKGTLISDIVTLAFESKSDNSTEREQKHQFVFKNQLAKLNGQDVTLKMERQVSGTSQFAPYKEVSFKVSILFQAEF